MEPVVVCFDLHGVLTDARRKKCAPRPGAGRMLEELRAWRNVKVGIWTCGMRANTLPFVAKAFGRRLLEKLDFFWAQEQTTVMPWEDGDDGGGNPHKPNFKKDERKLASHLGVPANRILFIDDSAKKHSLNEDSVLIEVETWRGGEVDDGGCELIMQRIKEMHAQIDQAH